MKRTILIAACFLTAALAQGGGKEVIVAVGRQGAVEGELVKLGDTAIVVAIEKNEEELIVVPIRDVQWVLVKQCRYVGKGATIGAVSGFVIGAILGNSMADKSSGMLKGFPDITASLEGAGLGAALGLTIGFCIGFTTSSEEICVAREDCVFREVLNEAARYPAEPDQMNR